MNLQTKILPALLFATLLTGCQPDPVVNSAPPTPAPNQSPAPTEQSESLPPPATTTKEEAWPKAQARTIDAALEDGRSFIPLAFGDDATVAAYVPDQAGQPKQVAFFDLTSGKSEVIATLDEMRQITHASINRDWIVWVEDGIMGASALHWQVHLYDRKQHQDRILFEQAKDTETPLLMMPQLDENTFCWGEAASPFNGFTLPTITVQKYNIATGKNTNKTTINGWSVYALGDTLFWNGRPETNTSTDLDLLTNASGKPELLTHGELITNFVSDGKTVAWSSHNRRDQDSSEPQPWTLHLQQNGLKLLLMKTTQDFPITDLTMTPRLITWSTADSNNVYDRKLNKIVSLSAPETAYTNKVIAKGDYLFWTTPIKNADAPKGVFPSQLHILDTKSI